MDEAKPATEKPAEKIELSDEAREAILKHFIDLFKENREVDADVLAKRVGKFRSGFTERGNIAEVPDRTEVDAFLTQMVGSGETEKNAAGRYEFTDAGLDKYADRIFWYPTFRLMRNPFVTFEAGVEGSRGIIAAPMIKRSEALISARASAIIEGERGCGKSSVICWFKIDGPDVVTAISPRNVEGINRAIRKRVVLKLGRDGYIVGRILAEMGASSEEHEKYRRAVAEVGRGGHLFDVPDNLSPKAAFELADLCMRILDEGGFIILFSTLEQARLLKRLDTFARFPVIKFERPSERFFYRLFASRVDAAMIGEAPDYAIQVGQMGMTWKRTYPIDEKALEKVIKAADHNPRRFILICSRILTEMRERRMDKPLDEKAADELLKGADVLAEAPVDIDEALKAIMRESGSGGAKWVKVKDIRTALLERYGIDLRPETIGRRLTEMGYPKRYSPDAEYLAAEIARKDDGGTP